MPFAPPETIATPRAANQLESARAYLRAAPDGVRVPTTPMHGPRGATPCKYTRAGGAGKSRRLGGKVAPSRHDAGGYPIRGGSAVRQRWLLTGCVPPQGHPTGARPFFRIAASLC